MLFQFRCQSINRLILIQYVLQSKCSDQHGVGKGKEKGEIRGRGRDQQEAEHAVTSATSTSSQRFLSQEPGGHHLQDQHGKEAPGASKRKKKQPGQYIINLKQKPV